MTKFVPKEKMSKKAQKELNRRRRAAWDVSPVTKTVESRKIYSRKRKAQNRDDFGLSFFDAFRRARITAGCAGSCPKSSWEVRPGKQFYADICTERYVP